MKRRRTESESDMSAGGGAGEAFRVSVNMEALFSDERRRAYVSVRGEQLVRVLLRRLRALFPLPPRVALLCRGHLLPPDEPLALLRPDDVVDVVPSCIAVDRPEAETNDVDSVCAIAPRQRDQSREIMSDTCAASTASERDVAPALPAPAAPPASGAELEHDELLLERKRRALQLLEQCCGEETPLEERAARPRRRRVRRRRRERTPPPPFEAPGPSEAPGPAVLRNGSQTPRAPRLIQPLTNDLDS